MPIAAVITTNLTAEIGAYMKEMDVDVIVLAGFLAILGGDLLKEYANKLSYLPVTYTVILR